jgi:hypothetical protein
VVVDEVDGAGDGLGAELSGVVDEPVAGESRHRLGTARVAAAFHHFVEFVEEALGQGNAEAGEAVFFGGGGHGAWAAGRRVRV